MNAEKLQTLLFQEIRRKLPSHYSLADSIAQLLDISQDSAYRRIRGEKPISLEELHKLCEQYGLSADRLLNLRNDAFTFHGNLMDENDYDIEAWLSNLSNITQLIKLKPHHHIYYLAKDVPFVYPLQFPALAAFKEFFRKRALLPPIRTRGVKFSVHNIDASLSHTASQIVKMYNTIPGTEIWSSESFNSIIKQIQFYSYTGQLNSKDDQFYLYDMLDIMIQHLEHQAELGLKYIFGEQPEPDAAAYKLYNNELFIGEDTIVADLGETRITFINHSFINYMTTMDENFCNYTFKTMKNIIARSTPVSWAGEKDRKIFFNGLRGKLKDARSQK